MKLKTTERVHGKKSELNRIRHEQNIPAVLYDKEGSNKPLIVDGADFSKALREIEKGHLSTTVFELDINGVKVPAVVKEVQYHKTTYNILHLDFQKLEKKSAVTVNVPVTYTGVDDCVGIKLGGFLRQVKRTIRVKTMPEHMPKSFTIDVRGLGIRQSKRIKDIEIPANVVLVDDLENVVVTIAK
ncbi:MAG: 50S ribosomal protein L25 [Chlamydiae bacterium]|jgi:large subunit ribosomal protein L25|nr:50S ribosomal protein L25 [Chlamydiota bacterium]